MTSYESTMFVVENGINTCYIDSLLMGLFYIQSHIHYNMLEVDPKYDNLLYLQDVIKFNFVECVRKNKSVTAETMNYIRNYMFFQNKWLNNNDDELIEQQDVSEFYKFINNILGHQYIEIKRTTVTEGLSSKNDDGVLEFIPYIPLPIPNDTSSELSVKDLLKTWLTDNPITIKRETLVDGVKVVKEVRGVNTYTIMNTPQIVPLYVNRFNTHNSVKNNVKIDIQHQIRLFDTNDDLGKIKWGLHSVICHTGDTVKNGHYYTLLNCGNKWCIFDDQSVPSMSEVDMKKQLLIDKIKSEAVFLIYRFE